MIIAELSNPNRPNACTVDVSCPIDNDEAMIDQLKQIGIGDAVQCDCFVEQISGSYPSLKCLEKEFINMDELNYLAKRLESFDSREIAKFQGVVAHLGYSDMIDLINLTFCVQDCTIVKDFSSLEAIGRQHYLDVHGCATMEEMQSVNFNNVALDLLLNQPGKITPYGVIYIDHMNLEQIYDGQFFPDYDYTADTVLKVAMTAKSEPEDTARITWLNLPIPDIYIKRSMLRAGINTFADARLVFSDSELPGELDKRLSLESETLQSLNDMCKAVAGLDQADRRKLDAAVQISNPIHAVEVSQLARHLHLFDFYDGVSTPEEYGRHMIMESGRFEYDDNLAEYYDFKRYGEQRIKNENGCFTRCGYISYNGFISINEVLAGSETERMEMTMGGM